MASGAIKGITIKLGSDASELVNSLNKADQSLKDTQKQLNDVNKALKFNPNNVDLLKQKATLLEQKIKDNTQSIKDMKTALKQMDDQGIDKTSKEYMDLERAIIEAESKQKTFNKQLREVKALSTPIAQLGTKFKEVGGKIESVGQSMRGISMAAGAVVASLGAITYKAAQAADDLNTLSSQYGIATKDLQLYAAASELVDVSVNDIAKANVKLKKSMLTAQQGSKNTLEVFDKLGVSIEDNNGHLRNQDEMFQEVIQKLGQMKNETERDAYAMTIFGRSAANLNPLIEDMGETYKNVADTFKKNNIEILDQDTIDQANKFNDMVDTIKATVQQAFLVIGAKLSGYLAPAMEKVANAIGVIAGKIANMNPAVLSIVGALAGILAITAPLLIAIGRISTGIGGLMMFIPKLTGMLSPLFTLIAANPFTAVAVAVGALAAAFVAFGCDLDKLSDTLSKKLESAINGIVKIIPRVAESMETLIPKIVEVIVKNLPKLIAGGVKITTALAKGIVKAIPTLVKSIPSLVKAVVNGLKVLVKEVGSIGKNIVVGLWNGIKNKVGWLIQQIKSFASNVKNALKSFFGIKSPSKWAKDMIGKNIVLGMAKGISGNADIVNNAMSNLVPKTIPKLNAIANPQMTQQQGTVYSFGNITLDVKELKDAVTIEQIADTLIRAKKFAPAR